MGMMKIRKETVDPRKTNEIEENKDAMGNADKKIGKTSIRKNKAQVQVMLRQFFPLLITIGLQMLLALIVNLVDNFMLGAYSETAMSGASLVNQIQFVVQQITGGIAAGITVLGAQYWGKQDTNAIKKIISVGLKFAFAVGLIFSLATAIFPREILDLFTTDPAILEEGVKYLQIMSWTYLIFAISSTLMRSLQCVETAFIGTIMSASTIVINFCVNYVLIYGNFGAPALGIRGAAYATLASRIVELLIILIYILWIDKKLKMQVCDLFRIHSGYLKDFIQVAFPLMISGAMWGVAQAAQTAVLGHINATTIAANSIAVTVFQVFLMFGSACANASAVIMGKTVTNNREMIRTFTCVLQICFLCIGIFLGALLLLFKDGIVNLYNVTDETKELAKEFLLILGITMVGSVYEYPVMSGIIAGGGDTKYEAIVDNSFMWIFTIPMACLSAFVFHWTPIVTFLFLKLDQFLKCIPNGIYCNTYKWVKDWTR